MHPQSADGQTKPMHPRAPQLPRSWTPDCPPAVGQGPANPAQYHFAQTNAANGNRHVSFEINTKKKKKNDTLEIFSADIDDYEMWHDRLVDHISQSCSMRKTMLEFVEKHQERITKACMGAADHVGEFPMLVDQQLALQGAQ